MDRRSFFRRLSGLKKAIRPLGSLPGEMFHSRCNGCNACVEACPQNLIKLESGFPVVSFKQDGCSFCQQCSLACKQGALVANESSIDNWLWRAEISDNCLDKKGTVCRGCQSACENDSIRFSPALGGRSNVNVDLSSCTGCGNCIRFCPVSAISMAIIETQSISQTQLTQLTKEEVA